MFRFSFWLSSLRMQRPAPSRRLARLALEALEDRAVPAVFLVTNANDSGDGSLRQAILDANDSSGEDEIHFNINDSSAIIGIDPESPLPTITEAVLIDGFTQPGTRPNSQVFGFDGLPLIVLSGFNAGPGANGLTIQGPGTIIRGLQIFSFQQDDQGNGGNGIVLLDDPTTAGNTIEGVILKGNQGNGIVIGAAAGNNRIGGLAPGQRNVIGGNDGDGILVLGNANVIQGNFIGTIADGDLDDSNGGAGIDLRGDANLVGGVDPAARNLISSNVVGIRVEAAGDNQFLGNFIGTDVTGTQALPNGEGVFLTGDATDTLIAGNLISANLFAGINVFLAEYTIIRNNLIGTDVTGTRALGNLADGVQIGDGSTNNVIGGVNRADRNVISANGGVGVEITGDGATGNRVQNNLIGTNIAGDAALGNDQGIFIEDAGGNFVIENVISGNAKRGVEVTGEEAVGNVLQGNVIGLARNGVDALGNGASGIEIVNGPSGTLIGGDDPSERNVIAANGGNGVALIFDVGPTLLVGNYIGTDVTGTLARGNVGDGVLIISANNQVLDNLISANQGDGIDLVGPSATGNLIQGNLIGTDAAGTADLGNDDDGVDITGGASGNIVGGIVPGQGNIIAFNGNIGVRVADDGTIGNTISGNAIFDNGELGIDLNGDGPTPNHPLDADASPNNLQNTPVLSKIVQGPVQTVILGSIHSSARTRLRIELFANAVADPSGSGEGRRFLGHVDVLTNKKGRAAISFRLAGRLAAGEVVTATATNLATGDTSEFSAGLQVLGVVRGTKYIDRNGNGVINRGERGLGGVTVFADLNDNGVLDAGDVSTVTAANGAFTLLIPQDGTFAIREVVPAGFRQTTPDRLVTIAGANVVNRVLIGNQRLPPDPAGMAAQAATWELDSLVWTNWPLTLNNIGGWARKTGG